MKQIPIYKGISKKVTVFGPALVDGQKYKCVIFPDLTDATHTISTISTADETETGSGKVFVEFTFPAQDTTVGSVTTKGTVNLKLGDNNLAVYDVNPSSSATLDEYTMYKVYEAKVYAEDSYARVEQEAES